MSLSTMTGLFTLQSCNYPNEAPHPIRGSVYTHTCTHKPFRTCNPQTGWSSIMPNLYFSSLQIPLRRLPFICLFPNEWHLFVRQSAGLLGCLYQRLRDVGLLPALWSHFLPSPEVQAFVKTGFPFVRLGWEKFFYPEEGQAVLSLLTLAERQGSSSQD